MGVKKERRAGLDLLKIFAMLGVIILHFNNRGIGNAFGAAPLHSTKSYVLYFLQSLTISAVNVFVLISGYLMGGASKVDAKKPLRLLIQVIIFRELIYITRTLRTGGILSPKVLRQLLLPKSWFAILYAFLYLMAPFINRFLSSLSDKRLKTFLGLAFFSFSVWPYGVDLLEAFSHTKFDGLSSVGMYGSQFGYTIVNFFLMYCIGAAMKRLAPKGKVIIDLSGLLGCTVALFLFSYYLVENKMDTRYAFSYGSPLVILSAVFLLRLFNRIPVKSNKVITFLASCTFPVYLLNSAIITDLLHVSEYVKRSGVAMLVYLAITCAVVLIISAFAQLVYDLITKPIYKLCDKIPINTVIHADEP